MSTDIDENLNDWLHDAHAMEQQAEKMLTAQAGRLDHLPKLTQAFLVRSATPGLEAKV